MLDAIAGSNIPGSVASFLVIGGYAPLLIVLTLDHLRHMIKSVAFFLFKVYNLSVVIYMLPTYEYTNEVRNNRIDNILQVTWSHVAHRRITFIKIVVVNPPPPVQSPGVCHLSMEMADERDGQR